MNYKLSCAANLSKNKAGYILELAGREIAASFFKCKSDNLKVCILDAIRKGIRLASGHIKHEDILIIAIDNSYLVSRLSGVTQYKEFCDEIDDVLLNLESVDCKYRFVYEKKTYVNSIMSTRDYDKIKVSSIDSVMDAFK